MLTCMFNYIEILLTDADWYPESAKLDLPGKSTIQVRACTFP
jgi:hypothetical protein